jgi:hypothetical protein
MAAEKFEPLPPEPTPEEIAHEQGKAIVANLRMTVLAGIAAAGQCSRLALDLIGRDTRNVAQLGQLVATASTALECAERAQKLIATAEGDKPLNS